MPHKRVLLATRPLTPPWDEASKNFAYFLGREISDHALTLLTTDEGLSDIPATSETKSIYESSNFGLTERIILLNYLRTVRDRFDITHYLFTPTLLNTTLIKLLAKPTRGKTIQTVATMRKDRFSDTELEQMLFADHIVVYTDLSKERVEKLGKRNVTRIYPGIDLEKYSPQPKFHTLLQSFGFDKNSFVVAYPGEYTRLGATDMLTDTFIRYFQEHPETSLRFLFACRVKNNEDRKKKAWVKNKFEQAGVAHYINFTDTIADMPTLYNLVDIIIFPVADLKGKFDVPLVIIESYACGKPVILSDLPEFREFTGSDFSVTLSQTTGEELLRAILSLQSDTPRRTALGINARRFVEKQFNLKDTAKAYSTLYDSLQNSYYV